MPRASILSLLLPKRLSPEELARRDAILARVIRHSYKIPDIPHWVEDILEDGCAFLTGLWRVFWRMVAIAAMFSAMYDVRAFLNQYPYMHIEAWANMVVMAAMVAFFCAPWAIWRRAP